MLSGIKTGKKRKARVPSGPGGGATTSGKAAIASAAAPFPANRSAADALRASLGGPPSGGTSSRADSAADAATSSALNGLERRGRIRPSPAGPDDDTVVVRSAAPSAMDVHEYEREHGVRFNARGRLSRHAHDELRRKSEREMTVEEMARAERTGTAGDMDETYARNIVKMGNKRFKHYSKDSASRSGADEEDYLQDTDNVYRNLYRSNDDKLSPAEVAARSRSRQVAEHDAMARFTGKSWWWPKSPRFDRRYLDALGDHVSLVMLPTHRTLQQSSKSKWTGGQCLLVPNEYSETFVGLDETAWSEVRRFQDSLRGMFKDAGRGVLFLETVTRASRSGGAGGYQCKMDVVPVPRSVERDAELYFKSALAEVAQEWGTHQRPIPLDGRRKTLRNAVPKGFPYFYCGWDGGGVVQLIEGGDDGGDDDEDGGAGGGGGGMRAGGGSRGFQRDFGVDTIGGMMDCDPVRFNRNRPAADGDRKAILEMCERWKKFDWTLELD